MYYVHWRSILGGGEACVPFTEFDSAVKYARSLPDVTVSIDCDVPERMNPETWAYVQSGVKA